MYESAISLPFGADGGESTASPWVGVYDCFSDAIFANLATSEAGAYAYSAAVFGYNKQAFDSDPSLAMCATLNSDAGCPAIVSSAAASATWAATCVATEVPGVGALANCCALEGADQQADASTDAFPDDAVVDVAAPDVTTEAAADVSAADTANDGGEDNDALAE
jgi:hypothetical protein